MIEQKATNGQENSEDLVLINSSFTLMHLM